MSKISKTMEFNHAKMTPKHTESSVERSYYNNSNLPRNKRLSASPNYDGSLRGMNVSSEANKNVPYFITQAKTKQNKAASKRAAKRKSLNVATTSARAILQCGVGSRSTSIKRGFKNTSSSPNR